MPFQYDLERKPSLPYRPGFFKELEFGKWKLSIQGSDSHYCEPRATLRATEYTSMEVAIFSTDEEWIKFHNNDWAHPEDIPGCPLGHLWEPRNRPVHDEDFNETGEMKRNGSFVGGWIPVEAIQELIDFLWGLNQ